VTKPPHRFLKPTSNNRAISPRAGTSPKCWSPKSTAGSWEPSRFFADASTEGLGLPEGWAGFRTLAVHPAARGRGIARALSRRCVDAARARNTRTVGIHTAAFMRTACGIYEQIGFRRCPEHDLRFSAVLGLDLGAHDIPVIAYRLDLADN
jgi:hypothetical protein